jgi:hypothetical protein
MGLLGLRARGSARAAGIQNAELEPWGSQRRPSQCRAGALGVPASAIAMPSWSSAVPGPAIPGSAIPNRKPYQAPLCILRRTLETVGPQGVARAGPERRGAGVQNPQLSACDCGTMGTDERNVDFERLIRLNILNVEPTIVVDGGLKIA